MKVVLLFSPDGDFVLCKPDPLDKMQNERRHYLEIPDSADVITIWREWGDEWEGGYCDHVFAQGIFENVTPGQVDQMIAAAEPRIEEE